MMICCAKCGFLTVRNPETRLLEEVDEEAREKGLFPSIQAGILSIGLSPQCSRMAADLGAECRAVADAERKKVADSNREIDGGKIYLAVLTKDRDCPKFSEWHPGFSPKEHREMLFDVERKKLEMQERENERQWQEKREQRQRRFQLANTLISAVVGAICTAVIGSVVATFLAAKKDAKPTILVQPIQTEKAPVKPE